MLNLNKKKNSYLLKKKKKINYRISIDLMNDIKKISMTVNHIPFEKYLQHK